MGQLLIVAVGALGDSHGGQEVVRAAIGGPARRVAPFRIGHDKNSFRVSARFIPAPGRTRSWLPSGTWRSTLNSSRKPLGACFSGLDPVAEPSQRLPAEVVRTYFAGARLIVAVLTAARAKSLAVGLAQRPDRQGQKHLLAQHIFKRKTVLLIITDFRFRRSNRSLRRFRVGRRGTEDQVELGSQRNLHRLDAAGTGNLESARKAAPEPDVGHNVPGPAMLVQHLGSSGRGQLPGLFGLIAEIHRSRSQLQVKVDRLALQLAYLEFHALSLRRGRQAVNEGPLRRKVGTPGRVRP